MTRWDERDRAVLWHPFTQQSEWEPLVIQRGDGNYLIDVDGHRYLDGVASLWCNLHGHNHPRINAAIEAQLRAIAHSTFLGLSHTPGIVLAERLLAAFNSGEAEKRLDRVFYSDSGSTAVEVALKLAFQYCQLTGQPERRRFLHLTESYHGDTLGAVGVGGIEVFHQTYGPIIVPAVPVPTPFVPASEGLTERERLARGLLHVDRALDEHGHHAAAFIVEPLIQGAAGMLTQPRGFLKGLAARCEARGVPLIVDEVATGFGRTGTVFACEQEGVVPDFLCLAKGISGGYLPLAATLTTEAIYEAFLGEKRELKHFFHGHTYTANPLACAAAIASLDLVLENRDRIGVLPVRLQAALEGLDSTQILEIRGVGSMIGIELGPFAWDRFVGAQVCEHIRAHGVILRPLGDVIVWMPPLSITDDEISLLARATEAAIHEVLD